MLNVQRYDAGKLRPARRLPDGRVRADAYITRVGVFRYYNADGSTRLELRHPDDVFDRASLDSFSRVPITNDHPDVGLLTSRNAKRYAVGMTGEKVAPDGEYVANEIDVYDAETIDAMDNGKVQLSGGYTCDLEMSPGVHPVYGRYDARQRNIRGNHVAIVDAGRAGYAVRARMDGAMVTDDVLSAAERHQMPAREFAVPETESLPIGDAEHVRAAMARFGQTHFRSPDEKRSAYHKIVARARALGVDPAGFVAEWSPRVDEKSALARSIELRPAPDVSRWVGMDPQEALRAVNAQLKDAEARADKAENEAKAEKTRADVAEGELKIAQTKIQQVTGQLASQQAALDSDALKNEKARADGLAAKVAKFDETFTKAVRSRAKLENVGGRVMGAKFRMDDLDDRQIQVEVIKKLDSTADTSPAVADGVITGMFNALVAGYDRQARQYADIGDVIAAAPDAPDAPRDSRADELAENRKRMRNRGKLPLPSDIRSRTE